MKAARYSGLENLEVMQEAKNYNRYLLDLVLRHVIPGFRILDFGAGSGEFALPVSARGHDITAVEPDTELQAILTAKQLRVIGTVDQMPENSFDYVYTLNVLEHIRDDVAALRMLHRVLKPEGRLLVYVPAFPILYTSMDARVGHVRRYTKRTLKASVEAAGFKIDHMSYVDALGFVATLIFKTTGNNQGTINRSALKLYDKIAFPISRVLDIATLGSFGKNLVLLGQKR